MPLQILLETSADACLEAQQEKWGQERLWDRAGSGEPESEFGGVERVCCRFRGCVVRPGAPPGPYGNGRLRFGPELASTVAVSPHRVPPRVQTLLDGSFGTEGCEKQTATARDQAFAMIPTRQTGQ